MAPGTSDNAIGWENRAPKPRDRGKTMMIDFGPDQMGWTGLRGIEDLLDICADAIDYAKIYAMNAVVMPKDIVRRAAQLYRDHNVQPFTGGILFEYAHLKNNIDGFITHLNELNISGIEISENYITLTEDERDRYIERFQKIGIDVSYEFGRKNPEGPLSLDELESIVTGVTEGLGVPHVIVEQCEIDELAEKDPKALDTLAGLPWFHKILIEADPYRFPQQHAGLIKRFGPDVNLANIAPGQVYRLEGLRLGIGRAVDYSCLAGLL
ncbi:MAG: phosphosulfolactate synthase [Rhodospirillales bacterium]